MTADNPSSTTTTPFKGKTASLNSLLMGVYCALILGVVTWLADVTYPHESMMTDQSYSQYNLLVQGFLSGHLNMKLDVPAGFDKLKDPYDPIQNRNFRGFVNDASYYKGKFYLYFGITPVLMLNLPWAAITGHFLSDRYAVAIFFAFGFFAMWQILCGVRLRYFPETSFGAFAPGIFLLGLGLALTQGGLIYDSASVCAMTFALLALAGIWLALHESSSRKVWSLAFASLCYGLAVGARPTLLFGGIILLIPVAQGWHEAAGAAERRKALSCFLPAIGPIALVGLGLMIYNDLRFDSPFELGRRYQLVYDYEATTVAQLNPRYFGFNFIYYFLEPVWCTTHFPFLQDSHLPPLPAGYSKGLAPNYGGILFKYPFVLTMFALPWLRKSHKTVSPLDWFILALFLLFMACAPLDCLLLTSSMRYALDFLAPLLLLAFVGVLALERNVARLLHWRHAVRWGWYLLLCYALALNALTNVKIRAYWYAQGGSSLLQFNKPDATLDYLHKALSLDPGVAMYHNIMGIADWRVGQIPDAFNEERIALAIDPNYAPAQYSLGSMLYQNGQGNEAFKYFDAALKGDPNHSNFDYANENIEYAWMIASNPTNRNTALAVKMADAACQETQYKDATTLVGTAAVYIEAARTNEAMSLAEKGIEAAEENGQSNVVETGQNLIKTYRKEQTPQNKNRH